MARRARRGGLCACTLLALSAGACRTPAPLGPLQLASEVESVVEQRAGALLDGGPAGDEQLSIDPDPQQAWVLRFELYYLEDRPPTLLVPLATRTRFVAAFGHRTTFLPASELMPEASSGSGDEALRLRAAIEEGLFGRTALLAEHVLALPLDTTAVFSLRAQRDGTLRAQREGELAAEAPRAEREAQGELRLHVSRAADGLALGVARRVVRAGPTQTPAHGFKPEGAEPEGAEPEGQPESRMQHELLPLVDRPARDGAPLALVLPASFAGDGRAFVLLVSVASPPAPDADPAAVTAHARATEAALEALRAHAIAERERTRPGSASTARRRIVERVLADLGTGAQARATMVSLASAVEARVALDLALTAADADFARFAAFLASQEVPGSVPEDQTSLAWLLDRRALEFLAREQLLGDELPELEALLLVHTGQVGRYPGAVIEHLERNAERAGFDAAVLGGNLELLAVQSAAERVRAYDWLVQRGLAPEGFEPLATEDERRAALAARAEAEAPGAPAVPGAER